MGGPGSGPRPGQGKGKTRLNTKSYFAGLKAKQGEKKYGIKSIRQQAIDRMKMQSSKPSLLKRLFGKR
jgi:hypothetical protein